MTALPLYQIEGWNDYFENAKSRTYDRCQYVVSPNKHGGSGWANVMGEPDGRAIWGVWKMLLDICSRQRKPREGWLTADGKKNGRRLTERELSNQLRCPLEEIQRALFILRSPEVAFMRIADGQPESLASIVEGYRADSSEILSEYPASASAEDTAVSSEYPSAILSSDTESKKVSKKDSLSKGSENGAPPTDTSQTREGRTADSGRIPEGSEAEQEKDIVQHAEAKLVLGKLAKDVFPDEAPGAIWDNKLDHELCEILPVNRAVLEKVDWAYRLPEGHKLFKDGPQGGGMMRVKSFSSLIPNLRREASKVAAARKKIGLNGLHSGGDAETVRAEPWTDELRVAAISLYGDQARLTELFGQMPASSQAEIRHRSKEVAA